VKHHFKRAFAKPRGDRQSGQGDPPRLIRELIASKLVPTEDMFGNFFDPYYMTIETAFGWRSGMRLRCWCAIEIQQKKRNGEGI
jgi:hypothetical protein